MWLIVDPLHLNLRTHIQVGTGLKQHKQKKVQVLSLEPSIAPLQDCIGIGGRDKPTKHSKRRQFADLPKGGSSQTSLEKAIGCFITLQGHPLLSQLLGPREKPAVAILQVLGSTKGLAAAAENTVAFLPVPRQSSFRTKHQATRLVAMAAGWKSNSRCDAGSRNKVYAVWISKVHNSILQTAVSLDFLNASSWGLLSTGARLKDTHKCQMVRFPRRNRLHWQTMRTQNEFKNGRWNMARS